MTIRQLFLRTIVLPFCFPCLAAGSVIFTQTDNATPHAVRLDFDEPGTPLGMVEPDAFLLSHGISALLSGDGAPVVGDHSVGQPWVGTGNSVLGDFGVLISFDDDLTEFSANLWGPAPPMPFPGSLQVQILKDGAVLDDYFGNLSWGDMGLSGLDVTTDNGTTFDEVRFLGISFPGSVYADDLSWTIVPEPVAAVFFGFGVLGFFRRRE